MELTAIMLRTVLMYLFVFVILRIMGKREIGKLSVFDLVISIMIAEIAVISIEAPTRSLYFTLGPIALLVLIQLAVSRVTLKNRKLRIWFEGQPSIIINRGRLNWKEMKLQRYSLDDLMMQLRENRIDDIGQVELAVLESSGKLSVFPKDRDTQAAGEEGIGSLPHSESPPKTTETFTKEEPLRVRYGLLPLPLIMDGEVQEDSLEKLGKNLFWLKQELRQQGVREFKQVYFCSVDHKGKLFIDKRM